MKGTMQFDHEKLDVYQLELQFIAWVSTLLSEISEQRGRRVTEVSDQLDRASLSSLLNTAEGNGKRQRPARAKFFDDARGSATESAACLDALVAKQACTADRVQPGKEILLRIVSILTKLVAKFEADSGNVSLLREEPPDYDND
jgi:four helix bundle protein